jgi:cyclopropane fatty-acyl-phospholipid synthase-like methyltransferase
MVDKNTRLRLDDHSIGHIAQLLQVAILTGTDIIDNLRTARFTIVDDVIHLHPDYAESFQTNINELMEEATTAIESTNETKEDE